jgi:predicted RNA-binding Zn-ribbon protein involved in translation (DUF1610 family)
MNDNPLCQECGEEMDYKYSYTSQLPPYYEIDVYMCPECGKVVEVS